jgi:hypothetical protein
MATDPKDWELANKGKAQDAFQPAAQGVEMPPPQQQQGHGSDMVKNKALAPALTPKGPVRNAVDGQTHMNALSQEQSQATARQAAPAQPQKPPVDLEKVAKARALNATAHEFNGQAQSQTRQQAPPQQAPEQQKAPERQPEKKPQEDASVDQEKLEKARALNSLAGTFNQTQQANQSRGLGRSV